MHEPHRTFMYRMQWQQRSLVLVLLLCCCCQHVAPHALMVYPPSRNWLAYLEQNYYWSHGLSAGGEVECLRGLSLCKKAGQKEQAVHLHTAYLQAAAATIAGMRCVSAIQHQNCDACARSC